ncbi:MAG TPA: protein-L-isoaspartate(D-aspartate) O-methyltransferase [Pyrinomonadaceae bacterium]|nr:protein-L-isoaspartate(D-aspartate) O-methyltransferase [Pyrinomonadaceae bacterium]
MGRFGVAFVLGLMLLGSPACSGQFVSELTGSTQQSEEEFASQRRKLVEVLKSRGLKKQPVLDALRKVPRHKFVPASHQNRAYEDRALPIAHEQTISQPYIVGYMTEAADIAPGDRVLEIGTGSGYQAAVLAELAKEVYSIEIVPDLADSARNLLRELGYKNVQVKTGNGYLGWPEHAPFDAIVVTAAPPEVPQALVDQLAVGGTMVVPVGAEFQEMVIITKSESGVVQRRTIPVAFVPMVGKPTP